MEYFGIIAALLGGAGGNILGKSPLTGAKRWNKLLAPAAALATGLLYTKITGTDLPADQVMVAGGAIGGQAIGVYSGVKNLIQFFK